MFLPIRCSHVFPTNDGLTFQPLHREVVKEVEMEKRRFCVTLLNVGQLSRKDFPQGKRCCWYTKMRIGVMSIVDLLWKFYFILCICVYMIIYVFMYIYV